MKRLFLLGALIAGITVGGALIPMAGCDSTAVAAPALTSAPR